MRPKGSAAELQRRRMRAVDLLQEGFGPTRIAEMVGADRRSVQRWARRFERDGRKALGAKPHPGRPCRLDERQRAQLREAILAGPKANGFSTDLWTCPRIAQVIRRRFGVDYHPDYLSVFLRGLGFTPQRPKRRAYERDEAAIARWVARDWPRIKKEPRVVRPTSSS